MLAVCGFVAWYGTRLCLDTMGQTIAELPWLPVGVTYLAPEPGAAPYVTVGSKVVQGQTLLEYDGTGPAGVHLRQVWENILNTSAMRAEK